MEMRDITRNKEGDCDIDLSFFTKAFQDPCLISAAGAEPILLQNSVSTDVLINSFESEEYYGKENHSAHRSGDRPVSH